MGCSASAVDPNAQDVTKSPQEKNNNNNNNDTNNFKSKPPTGQNGHIQPDPPPYKKRELPMPKQGQNMDKNSNKLKALDQTPVPKSVAFDVTLDGEAGDGLLRMKKRPPRLQALEPLNLPTLTADQLAEKQKLADLKRERIKQKKIKASQKSSRRRQELLKAREFGMKQQMEQEKNTIDDSLKQAEMKREQRLIEIKEKQRIREERAKRARERAKRIQNPEEDVEVEKDEQFNAVSDDSWLDTSTNPPATAASEVSAQSQNNFDHSHDTQSGHQSHYNHGNEADEEIGLQKQVREVRPVFSASTVDSFDGAFTRNAPKSHGIESGIPGREINDDDFFGS